MVSSGLASLSRNQMSLNGHMEAGMEKGFYKKLELFELHVAPSHSQPKLPQLPL